MPLPDQTLTDKGYGEGYCSTPGRTWAKLLRGHG